MPIWRGTTSTDWNTASNWIIDGSGNSGVPITTTDAIFDALSTVLCTTGNTTRNCRDLITTGHTGTLQIGSGTSGDLRVHRNATIGGTNITGSSYLSMYAASAATTLDVQAGTTIPNFKSESQVATNTITLSRTTVVTNYIKTQALSGASVNFSAASAVELRVNNIISAVGSGSTTMGTNTTMRFMGGTFVTNIMVGAFVLNTGATLTGTGTAGAELIFGGTSSFDISAGTLVLPTISNSYRLGTGIQLGIGTLTLNMGTNELDYFFISTAGLNSAFLILQSNFVVNKGFNTQSFGVRVTTNGFNIITKESCSALNLGFVANSGKISFQGVPSASGFLGMGYISGTTLTLTSPPSGTLAKYQLIHFPTVTGANISNLIFACTTFNTTYTVITSMTVGSAISPVPIYGYGGIQMLIGNVTGGTHCLFEIDAGANNTYLFSAALTTSTSEIRYLSSNTGAFDGSKATISASGNGATGVIDFQGQSSLTKIINTLSEPGFFQALVLKSDLYVNDFNGGTGLDSGLLQSGGPYTLYVQRNFTAGVSTPGRAFQPLIRLEGSTPANFTCGSLLGNLQIAKSGGTTVTVTQSFSYGYATATTLTYTSGIVNFGATTMTITGNCTIVNPTSVGNFSFNNIIIGSSILTITNQLYLTGALSVSGAVSGTTIFAGSHGFDVASFICSIASTIIRFQNIVANAAAEYIVRSSLNINGPSATQRITLESAGRANFTGSIETASPPTGSTMNVASLTSGTISTGMTVSQASGVIPTGLSPFITDRPIINSGAGLSWVLNKSLSTRVPTPTGTIALAAGYKAKFTFQGTVQSVSYTTTQDIDSSFGNTILSFGSNGDDTATNTALFRTLNWGPLIAPSGSVYYTFVS